MIEEQMNKQQGPVIRIVIISTFFAVEIIFRIQYID